MSKYSLSRVSTAIVALYCFIFIFSTSHADNIAVAYIGYSTDKPFWVSLGESIRSEAENNEITLIDLTPTEPDIKIQSKLIEHAVNKKVDALIVGANAPSTLANALSKALVAHIPVIAVDTMIDHPAVVASVTTDNDKGASLAGKYIVNKTGGQGTLLILGGSKNHPNGDARKNGVTSEAKAAGMPVLFHYADWDDGKAYSIAAEELRKENTISAIFSCWDPGIDTVSHVVENMKLDKKLVLVGFDGLPRTRHYISLGRVTATVAQDTQLMGKKSIELVLQVIKGQSFPAKTLIPPFVVDSGTIDTTN